MKPIRLLTLFVCFCPLAVYAQTAEVGGAVQDPSGAVIPKASVEFRNQDTGIRRQTTTNKDGYYHIVGVDPGKYDATVQAKGFKTLTRENITFQVGDKPQIDFKMQVGSEAQSVTVDGSGTQINTTDGSVSTVVNRQFVANMPLNGRSFQDLISMTPGVVTATPQNSNQSPGAYGDFSINGQRTESNYYIVDGVAANSSSGPANVGTASAQGGVVAAGSAFGTTQTLLSVDALQEFRVNSSTYSAEYGRSPGGQISFLSRSGTNDFHGTVFDYLRNGWFDANDWFNDELGQPKAYIHQNDFGGTFGGPIWIPGLYRGIDHTFFFASYEGLRLTQPEAASVQYVPDIYMRQQAPPVVQALLNAFPKQSPNGVDYGTAQAPNLAQFFQGYSLPGSIDSTSIRLDHTFTPRLSSFFRFSDTPSSSSTRALSAIGATAINSQAYTFGNTYVASSKVTDEFRLGYTRGSSTSSSQLDNFGGATPIDLGATLGFVAGQNSIPPSPTVVAYIPGVGEAVLRTSVNADYENQWNIIDSLAINYKSHQFKFGADYRRINSTIIEPPLLSTTEWESAAQVLSNTAGYAFIEKILNANSIYNQTALFAQDEWKVNSRLSLSLGLRWEVDPAPYSGSSVKPYVVLGNLNVPSSLSLSAPGVSLWKTPWFNFAPRLGLASQIHNTPGRETVFRAGAGVFFDTANQAGDQAFVGVGYEVTQKVNPLTLPYTTAQQSFVVTAAPPYSGGFAYPTHLQLPYTLEWSTAIEQGLGRHQTLTVSYVGSAGRRLIQTQKIYPTNTNFPNLYYIPGGGVTSNYHGLQTKFQRQMGKGLNALASYTWSHSLDYGSNFSAIPVTYGNSDFDVRHNLQAGLSWDIPSITQERIARPFVDGWGLDGRFLARTGFPITLQGNMITDPTDGDRYYTNVNVVPNVPIYAYSSKYPGGRVLNGAAFSLPTGTSQGDAARNFVRGFGANQINLAIRRHFSISERLGIQFRAEAFNLLNHPNFGYVDPTLSDATFGYATKSLNQSLGTVASQYQQGGPRSMQFALKLLF